MAERTHLQARKLHSVALFCSTKVNKEELTCLSQGTYDITRHEWAQGNNWLHPTTLHSVIFLEHTASELIVNSPSSPSYHSY